ncbi:hypothetical protein QFZ63_003710 [Streptomyces sp. B3I7]|uniref:hypothetical protein n=1 Tax=Streptomyces sp. B3I7 TaxID=3042269 RepID=UPI0027825A51|nr:hypothetical protein [Streptomyces sp. B3I7]MDQ0811996.1 hypothetical protein [Streptomyces sp. B3I7]
MPTPHGHRGMAFGAEELRVLRRVLALALHSRPVPAEDRHDCRRLAASLDEATREAARQHAFLLADLARHRTALPATAAAYLDLLRDALRAGHRPCRDDLAALGALSGNPTAAALLARCRFPAARASGDGPGPAERPAPDEPTPAAPAPDEPAPAEPAPDKPGPVRTPPPPSPPPPPGPARGPGRATRPRRPVPTPGEVFPPKRRPAPPPSGRRTPALVG